MNKDNIGSPFLNVIKHGYCIGCGVCAAVSNSKINMKMNKFMMYEANIESCLTKIELDICENICPFSDKAKNEDELYREIYSDLPYHHKKIGGYISLYAGYVNKDDFREKGSSGGVGSWIISELLKNGEIDKVIHVKNREPSKNDSRLFSYQISSSYEEVLSGAKSKYYPIELSEVLGFIRNNSYRYLIVGIPCFIKSIRLLMKQDVVFSERIKYCIGLVCGHLKSTRFADMFAWQNGIHPNELYAIDFRTKLPDYGANNYGITLSYIKNNKIDKLISKPISQLYGANWGKGFFKYKACDYCDDVLAELADVTIGDAWLPQYTNHAKGTNIVIIRNPKIQELVVNSVNKGDLTFDSIDEELIIKSQQAGFNHRHDGLSYRLFLLDSQNKWRPQKRISAASYLSKNRVKIQNLRIDLAKNSHKAFYEAVRINNYLHFEDSLRQIEKKYDKMYAIPLYKKVIRRLKKIIN